MSDTSWFNGYGYWVGPEGEIVPLKGLQQHATTAREIWRGLDLPNTEYHGDEYNTLYSNGWTPVTITRNTLCVNFMTHGENQSKALAALQRVVRAHGQVPETTFYIDGHQFADDRVARIYLSTLIREERLS